jgi:hypothetical protein
MRNSRPSVDQRMLTAEKRLPEKKAGGTIE